MVGFNERLTRWRDRVLGDAKKHWWWIPLALLGSFIWLLLQDRVVSTTNKYLDSHIKLAALKPWANLLFSSRWWLHPVSLALLGVLLTVAVLIVRAYFETRPGRQLGAIVGNADLMLQELDIGDLEIIDDGASYQINLAAFVRMEVASLDMPRSVKRFELEMIAPDGTTYNASSEYEVGDYDYHYEVSKRNPWGLATVETVREPMEDLSAKLRTPIQPNTHVPRAWVRFEINGVKQGDKPENCNIRIFAIDPNEDRYEIATHEMRVKAIDSNHEYAIARGQ
jgi:hypothetical protein